MIEIALKNKKGITIEKALKMLKKKLDKENVFDEMKKHTEFVSKSAEKHKKNQSMKMK